MTETITEGLLPIGTKLSNGKYRIERHLSSGGFGKTYVAHDTILDLRVAVKELYIKGMCGRNNDHRTVIVSLEENRHLFTAQQEKFRKEARRLRQLVNPHIVHVYDLFDENETSYYVMDLVNGESLSQYMKRTGNSLTEQELLSLLPQILEALETVHAESIWHLDLKPANIMMDRKGNALLIDFGASKQQRNRKGLTLSTSSALAYTPGFASSEQMEQKIEKFGPWTDLYALGATMYNLLTLQQPPSPSDIDENAEQALLLPKNVSKKMHDLIFWLMTPNRTKRPQNVAEVRAFLENRIEGTTKSGREKTTNKKTQKNNQTALEDYDETLLNITHKTDKSLVRSSNKEIIVSEKKKKHEPIVNEEETRYKEKEDKKKDVTKEPCNKIVTKIWHTIKKREVLVPMILVNIAVCIVYFFCFRHTGSTILERQKDKFCFAFYSPDGKKIVSASDDRTIRIWDATTGKQIGEPLKGHTNSVRTATFSPNGKYIVSTSFDGTIRIWDVATCKQIGKPLTGHIKNVNSASFSPDGKYIVSTSNDSTIRIWDATTGKQIGQPLKGHTDNVRYASFSPDGKKIVSASADRTIRIWDATTGKQIGKPLEGHTWFVNFASFSPDGKKIVSASNDETIRIWDATTGKQIGKPLQGHTDWIHSVYFCPSGKYIVSASDDNTIRIWNASTGKLIGEPLKGHTGDVASASFSPDGKYIVSASSDGTIRIWDVSYLDD